MYTHMCMCICVYVYIYIYIHMDPEQRPLAGGEAEGDVPHLHSLYVYINDKCSYLLQ